MLTRLQDSTDPNKYHNIEIHNPVVRQSVLRAGWKWDDQLQSLVKDIKLEDNTHKRIFVNLYMAEQAVIDLLDYEYCKAAGLE